MQRVEETGGIEPWSDGRAQAEGSFGRPLGLAVAADQGWRFHHTRFSCPSLPSAARRSTTTRCGTSCMPRSSISSVAAGKRDRPEVARRRGQWTKYRGRLEAEWQVFIDEAWTRTDVAPLRGWALRGRRLHAKVPHGRWKTTTFLAALRHDRISSRDRLSFRTYVEKVLLPVLRSGDIVVLDNLGSHRGKAVRQLIRSVVGAKLFLLPKYSPDLSPIEQGLCRAQAPRAQSCRANRRCGLCRNRSRTQSLHIGRLRQLLKNSGYRT